ncbi:haloalkane dehalogenase [Aquimarina sp. 2201CG5-10]|uniref:haloalkane dehalogenase n=1 Tax=Aquimarina callyspongiae TaxID=3098150 RepID=UPI002AB534DA|nr:haloalkane dehalogenase [Aquimarina sp. 2201CG5-10]MDY8138413.1 haloalkane dehalogenase [Aquimarina sp. 2201CG5-10]
MAQKDQQFTSTYHEVLGSKMHVLSNEEGDGNPILFLHGNPSNSYLWRNIAPQVLNMGHPVYIPDLIGMGKSDKPDIDYTYLEQYEYLETLIDQLELKNITLVIHDWGSGLGFNYFANHPENVKAIAFMEGIIQDIGTYFDEDTQAFFKKLRGKDGWKMIAEDNIFLNDVLPTWVVRGLTEEELTAYKAPFQTVESRKPIWKFVSQVPFHGKPELTSAIVKNYREKLQESNIPKLFFYAEPGAFMPEPVRNWIIENIPNLEVVNIGKGTHFIQEDNPELIGSKLKEWVAKLDK